MTPTGDWRSFEPWEMNMVERASLQLFAARGFHGTSIRDVAARAGLSVPGLYHHASSKGELLAGLLLRGVREANERAKAAYEAGETGGPARQFDLLVESVALYAACRRDVARLGGEYVHLEPDDMRAYIAERDALESLMYETVMARSGGGLAVDEARHATRAIIVATRGIAGWFDPEGEQSAERIANYYVEMANRVVGPPYGVDPGTS